MLQLKINKNALLITYKLLSDSLFILIVFFAFMLIGEGLIPGVASNHISFLRIIFLIFFNIIGIYIVGNFAQIEFSRQKVNKKIPLLLGIFGIILILNSLLKLNLILAILILILASASGYLIYKDLIEKN